MKYINMLMLLILVSSCSMVGPGERGIRIHGGRVSTEVQQPGMYVWFPILFSMAKMDVQVQKSEVESSAASKDLQEITTKVAVNWSVNPEQVVTIYSRIGDESTIYDRVIHPAVNEIMKAAASKRTAEEVLTKRLEMKLDIDNLLKERLTTYGINLLDVNIVNLSFSKEFMTAVEKKQIAEQQAKEAEYVTLQAIQDAKAQVNRAKGQAEAQQLLQRSLTKEVLQMEYLKKWNGVLSTVTTGNGGNLLLDVSHK